MYIQYKTFTHQIYMTYQIRKYILIFYHELFYNTISFLSWSQPCTKRLHFVPRMLHVENLPVQGDVNILKIDIGSQVPGTCLIDVPVVDHAVKISHIP